MKFTACAPGHKKKWRASLKKQKKKKKKKKKNRTKTKTKTKTNTRYFSCENFY